jgi:hypothetical protein
LASEIDQLFTIIGSNIELNLTSSLIADLNKLGNILKLESVLTCPTSGGPYLDMVQMENRDEWVYWMQLNNLADE